MAKKIMDKWLNSDERAEKHKMVYDDLVEWVNRVYISDIESLCPMHIVIMPYYYREYPKVIQGALVSLIMETENIDSEAIKHIIHVLGSDRFTVMRGGEDLILKVYTTLFNNARASMRMCGMWTPKWERENEQKSEK